MKYNHNGEVIDEIRDLKEMNAGRKIQNTNWSTSVSQWHWKPQLKTVSQS
jgi:hypothetical protein